MLMRERSKHPAFARRLTKLPGIHQARMAVSACRSFVNQPQIRRGITLIHDLMGAAREAQSAKNENSPWLARAAAATHACQILATAMEVDPDTYFDGDEWEIPYASEFSSTIIEVLSRRPCRIMSTTRPGIRVMIADLEGCEVAWLHDQLMFDRPNKHVYVRSEQLVQARAKIREVLWSSFAGRSIVLQKKRHASYGSGDSITHVFEPDADEPALHSQTSRALSAYLGRALAGGVTRSLLLWGAPGTGKTSLARAVVADLGLRCLRLRIEDLSRLQNTTLLEALNVFGPEAVVVDDLDRMQGSGAHMFEMLSVLKRRVKLVLGTCNDKKKIPAALRRPGRWDERRRIEVIDHEVVRAMLGAEFADAFEIVKDWPIVYVEEYVVRRRFQAPEELQETVRELEECIQELREETEHVSLGDIEMLDDCD